MNLKVVVEDVMMAQLEFAEKRGVQISYEGPERPARVIGDRDQFYQVILNLVDNGIKYSREEGGEIQISLKDKNKRMFVSVKDDGIGISENDIPFIFNTAYRARGVGSFRSTGSGLGLAIVERIVKQHGGEIWVSSTPGEGTTFTFDIPLYMLSQ